MSRDPEKRRNYNREYHSRPDVKARRTERDAANADRIRERDRVRNAKRRKTAERKKYDAEYRKRPDVAEKRRAYRLRSDVQTAARARLKLWRAAPEGRAFALWQSARQRAEKKNIVFTISVEFVLAGILDGDTLKSCPYVGCVFDLAPPEEKGMLHPWSPSVDRKDPAKGYVPDNVEIVCTWYNIAKGRWPQAVNDFAFRAVAARRPES